VGIIPSPPWQVVDAVHSYTGSYSNYQQFGDWAADVDVIIVADCTCTYKGAMTVAACDDLWKNKFLSSLSATKAFKNQKIYDVGRTLDPSGGTDYFVSLPVEPDAFLADVIAVTWPSAAAGHNMVYLRNMFTEGVGNLRSCAAYNLTYGCVPSANSLSAQCTSLGAPADSIAKTAGIVLCPATSAATALAPSQVILPPSLSRLASSAPPSCSSLPLLLRCCALHAAQAPCPIPHLPVALPPLPVQDVCSIMSCHACLSC